MNLSYDYQVLSDELLRQGAICSAAELQGMLSGLLAGGRKWEDSAWIEHAREFTDLSHFESTPEQEQLILFMLEHTRTTLKSDEYSFTPMLPDDACPIADRAKELGAWCRGFLHGFGASGVTKDTELSADVAEVIRDIAQICTAVKAVEDEEEDTEADLAELVEYLRAGVITVYGEMNIKPDDASSVYH